MLSGTRIQILNEADYLSLCAKLLGTAMNRFLSKLFVNSWGDCVLFPSKANSLREEKLWFKPVLLCWKMTLCQILPVEEGFGKYMLAFITPWQQSLLLRTTLQTSNVIRSQPPTWQYRDMRVPSGSVMNKPFNYI